MRCTFVGGLALAVLCLPQGGSPPPFSSLASRSRGQASAPVTMYEMSDFQCPYCRQFALETMPVLEREYFATGKARLIYINFPLTSVHKHAFLAARVALCAARQGARTFWALHDRLFQRQPQWETQDDPSKYLLALADSSGARHTALAQCVASKESEAAVQADVAAAVRSGAHSTPTFYVEGGFIEGAAPAGVFRAVLDSIYRARTSR